MSKMKASVLHALNDMRCEEVDVPSIGDHDCLIKVAYAGICGSDLPRMTSSGARKYPLILGHEFSGVVAETGTDITKFKVGDKVAIAPLMPCHECEYCKAGKYGLCEDYTIIGTGCDGAFAEYVKVPEQHLLHVPDSLDLETASGIEPATISYHGVQKANIQSGESVAVLGCGPIGQFAIQWAKIAGASKVIAVDIFDDKLDYAKEMGADICINSKGVDLKEAIQKEIGSSVDVVIETAGSKFTQEQAILIAKKHGRIVYVGYSHSELPLSEHAAEQILRGELSITGSWNSYTMPYPGIAWEASISFMEKGDIIFKPMISHHISVEEVGTYISDMANRRIDFNKVLVKF